MEFHNHGPYPLGWANSRTGALLTGYNLLIACLKTTNL